MVENDHVSWKEFAIHQQKLAEEKSRNLKILESLRICDYKKNFIASLCKYKDDSFCTIDNMKQCKQQCPNGEIVKKEGLIKLVKY